MSNSNYQVIGDDLQALIVKLQPGEAMVAEPGSMMFMTDGISINTVISDKPSKGFMDQLFTAGKRLMAGENLFITIFENTSSSLQEVAFAAPYPGKLIQINLSEFGGEFICQRDSFLCATRGTEISIAFTKRIGAGFFGGEGLIMQRIQGNGTAFMHAGGTIHALELQAGQTLKVDTGCVVGFQAGVDYDIEMVKGFKNVLFGGEGLFYAILRGPGRVYLQTLPFSRLADRIVAAAPRAGGQVTGEGGFLSGGQGGLLGGLGDLIDGGN